MNIIKIVRRVARWWRRIRDRETMQDYLEFLAENPEEQRRQGVKLLPNTDGKGSPTFEIVLRPEEIERWRIEAFAAIQAYEQSEREQRERERMN